MMLAGQYLAGQAFAEHAVKKVIGELEKQILDAYKKVDYGEVIKIATIQFAFNMGVVAHYHKLSKEDGYDLLHRLNHGYDMPVKDRCLYLIGAVKDITAIVYAKLKEKGIFLKE